MEAVLLHETAHLTRRDPLWQVLTDLIRALFWFHPLVWFVVIRLRLEAESACDRHVLASGIAPDRYAHYLLEIVKMLKNRPAAPAMAHTPRLEGRVRSILAYLPTRPARGAGVTLALLGLVSVPLLAARPAPQKEHPKEQAKQPLMVAKQSSSSQEQEKVHEQKRRLNLDMEQQAKKKRLDEERTNKAVRVRLEVAQANRLRDENVKKLDEDAAKRKRRDEELALKKADSDRSRQRELEPLQEELDEVKIKLRDLDSRLTDKQLELAAIDREKMAFLDKTGQENKLKETMRSLEQQVMLLEKMIEETRQKRADVRVRIRIVSEH